MRADLRSRLAVAGVGVPACALVVYGGGLLFALGLGVVAAVGFWEYAAMMRATGTRVPVALGAAAALFFPLVVQRAGLPGAGLYAGALLMALSAITVARVPLEERPILSAAVTAFGVLYIGGLLSFGVPLREGWMLAPPIVPEPTDRLGRTLFFFYPVIVTWIADTAAYFGGRAFGRHRLAPRVSPNKTVEGAVAAVLVAPVAAVLYARWVLPGRWDSAAPEALLLGLAVGGFAIVGDLVESALKRECGVKDSSHLLPGHGGLLDRLDSVLWALPAAYFVLVLTR